MKATLKPVLLVVGALTLGGVVWNTAARASVSTGAAGGKDGGSIELAGKEGGSIELAGKDGGSVELAAKDDGGK